jgi:hypothetical protein
LIVKTRDTVVEINPIGNNVGIKLSGGADSSIVAYMLGVYKKNVRDINIVPITAINAAKPWQHLYAKRVVEFIEKDLDIKFADHIVPEEHADPSAYTEFQEKMMRDLYASNAIDCHFNGINLNPPIDLDPDRKFTYASERDQDGTVKQTVNKKGNKFAPLANVDKRGVAEIYQMFGLMNTLFPLTRSCENKFVAYAEPHCGDECWWCLERKWGFGRLE